MAGRDMPLPIPPEPEPDAAALLTQLEALAAADGTVEQPLLFRCFLRSYFQSEALDTLRLRSPQTLLAAALEHWRLALRRAPGVPVLHLSPPTGARALAVMQLCTDDLPFLVDTLGLCVSAAGAGIDWTMHPVLRLSRDASGVITGVGPASGEAPAGDGRDESLIHIEFDPLPGADAYAHLQQAIGDALRKLQVVVADYPAMRDCLQQCVAALQQVPPGADAAEFAEAQAFLRWLDDNHYTFLGSLCSATVIDDEGSRVLRPDPASGLGLLRAPGDDAGEALLAPQEQLDRYAESPRVVVVTKTAARSPIHQATEMDVISVRRFDAGGAPTATQRFIGLFASDAYIDRPRHIPLIRRKVEEVLRRMGLPEHGHSGKALRDILHELPRDELFQSSEDELYRLCMGIRALRDRHPLRLFMRRDRYGRFYACLVYLPRERYSRELRDRLAAELLTMCGGLSIDHEVALPRSGPARIHYVVRTTPGSELAYTPEQIELRLQAAARSWRERLRERLLTNGDAALAARFADAFPPAYADGRSPEEATRDVIRLASLDVRQPLLPTLQIERADAGERRPSALLLYTRERPVALSDVLPTLKHFGLRVDQEEPVVVTPSDGGRLWIQRFDVATESGAPLPAQAQSARFEAAFLSVWRGEVENDGLNRLVLAAGLDARQVSALRAMCKYLIQTGLPYSQSYMIGLLAEYAPIARLLLQLFEARFDPALAGRDAECLRLGQALDHALDGVVSLDGDRVLRAYLSVVRAALRTNYFQRDAFGQPRPCISFKLDPAKIPELPRPRPLFEIWVYAPQMEGIHLRGGRVARGGLRWSDRAQDFRTEVLGLMKAQMVKNAVIVPMGAKGGFVVKQSVSPGDREAWQAVGVACYRTFLRGLLDLTDNLDGDVVVPSADTVRYDGDDPYLVVAADKGTASFSDIANAVAAEYGYWLDDAFASGGSAGYDHKKMGITARGAWECVKRHFREIEWTDGSGVLRYGRDIQRQPFTCVGIGDMSGDVFGNGMLLSPHTRLVAAFDHRHIFVDPDPDAAGSHAERQRLFALPRSSWDDYDRGRISAGGGVWPRSAKSIPLSSQMRAALGCDAERLTPAELIRAILCAPVDLLWNGGIGTYVKAHDEADEAVGDRGNDAVRVTARALRCKVVGEGGNLGLTQAARIEYALAGGRINTDAIDNAGGVHTSDLEVNIKIPLNQLQRQGALTRGQRDPLLAACTGEIEQAVLHDSDLQATALSLEQTRAGRRLGDHVELMRQLEREGLLDRVLEGLPDDEALAQRRARGGGLTRPELAVLMAYAKLSLKQAALGTTLPDDPYFVAPLLASFPASLVQRYRDAYAAHRLRREIVATWLANAAVNRMGLAYAHLQAEDHGLSRDEVLKGYAAAREVFGGEAYWQAIEACDDRLPAALQYRLGGLASGLLKHASAWFANSAWSRRPLAETVQRFADPISQIAAMLPDILPPAYREDWQRVVDCLCSESVPPELARRLAGTRVLGPAVDIVELAEVAGTSLRDAAEVYYLCGERFGLLWLYAAINELPTDGKWQALARVNLRDDAYRIHRQLSGRVLRHAGATPAERLQRWVEAARSKIELAERRLAEVRSGAAPDFTRLAVAVREIRKLRLL